MHRLTFGKYEILFNEIVEDEQLLLVQIIVGDDNFVSRRLTAPKIRQTNIWLFTIRSACDYLRGGIPRDRIMDFVLNCLKKQDALFIGRIIINARGVNIGYLSVKSFFGSTDISDTPCQFFEIVKRQIGIL